MILESIIAMLVWHEYHGTEAIQSSKETYYLNNMCTGSYFLLFLKYPVDLINWWLMRTYCWLEKHIYAKNTATYDSVTVNWNIFFFSWPLRIKMLRKIKRKYMHHIFSCLKSFKFVAIGILILDWVFLLHKLCI